MRGGNDLPNDPLNDPLNDLPNDPLNDPLNDLPNDPLIVDPNYTGIQYTKRQSKIVDLVCKNFSITREELAKKLSVSVATVKREMKVIGYQWEGHSTKGHWVKE